MMPAAGAPLRVVVADDHDLVRFGIQAVLTRIEGVEIAGEARDGVELVQVVEKVLPDLVMTDISMPKMDGLSALAHIHDHYPQVMVLVLSMHDTVDFVKRAVRFGACGYMMKNAPPSELADAIQHIRASGSYFSHAIARQLLQPSPPSVQDELTERQIQILKLIAMGRASKEIAYELGLSSKTVDVHRARIMARLHLNDIASLTRYAVRHRLLEA